MMVLIFSLERYKQVIDAFIEGIAQADANGHDLKHIGSVASFFVSRAVSYTHLLRRHELLARLWPVCMMRVPSISGLRLTDITAHAISDHCRTR